MKHQPWTEKLRERLGWLLFGVGCLLVVVVGGGGGAVVGVFVGLFVACRFVCKVPP